jgi:hypothetical protein
MQIGLYLWYSSRRVDRTTLRVPNWVISKSGSSMHPTTNDVQTVYFEWFQTNGEGKDKEEAALLDTISSTGFNGGERGNALERVRTSKLTMVWKLRLMYRPLRYNNGNLFCMDAPIIFHWTRSTVSSSTRPIRLTTSRSTPTTRCAHTWTNMVASDVSIPEALSSHRIAPTCSTGSVCLSSKTSLRLKSSQHVLIISYEPRGAMLAAPLSLKCTHIICCGLSYHTH